MDKYNIEEDLQVFGRQVKTFPNGISEAFSEIIKALPPNDHRPYYGISKGSKDGMVYIAAALQKHDGEGGQYGYEHFTIEKGNYLAITVLDWLKKTGQINGVFGEIFKDERADRSKPCIEIYIDETKMLCLVRDKNQ